MISCIIPFKNDWLEVDSVVNNLLATAEDSSEIEIIICNDGSFSHNGKFKPLMIDNSVVRVIQNPISRGVGYSLDRGVEAAKGEIIVILGCDIYTQKGWDTKVIKSVTERPNSIGCAVCIGDKPDKDGNYHKRYGADLVITVDKDDLPPFSKLRQKKYYADIFKGRWRTDVVSDDTSPISCLMGAFYWTSKSYYQYIGGFDTDPKERWQGHVQWSTLEPLLSLKSWLVGGGCYIKSDLEATHFFNREGVHRYEKGPRSPLKMFWNRLWVLETMVMDADQRNKISNFLYPELNLNKARTLIKKNYANVLKVRERNEKIFTHDLSWLMERFNIPIKTR